MTNHPLFEPDRARWSYILDRVTVVTAVALPVLGIFLMTRTGDPFWVFVTVMAAIAMIGIAAFLRTVARPRPWRGMHLTLLALNIAAWVGIIAVATGSSFLLQYVLG